MVIYLEMKGFLLAFAVAGENKMPFRIGWFWFEELSWSSSSSGRLSLSFWGCHPAFTLSDGILAEKVWVGFELFFDLKSNILVGKKTL